MQVSAERQGGQTARSRPRDTSRSISRSPMGRASRSALPALAVGTTAWWSLTLALSQTCPASTASGAATPQMEAAASTSAGTPASISSVRYRLSVRG